MPICDYLLDFALALGRERLLMHEGGVRIQILLRQLLTDDEVQVQIEGAQLGEGHPIENRICVVSPKAGIGDAEGLLINVVDGAAADEGAELQCGVVLEVVHCEALPCYARTTHPRRHPCA